MILYYIENLLDYDFPHKDIYYQRDCYMADNVSFLKDLLCDKDESVIISCHLGHANYSLHDDLIHKTMGLYLKERYNDDYCCIGKVVYADSIGNYNKDKLEVHKLEAPSVNSLESSLANTELDYFYINSDNLPSLVKLRWMGYILCRPDRIIH
jgi:erythromycin esterase-like protein